MADRSGALWWAAVGDLAVALLLALITAYLLRRFLMRLAERHKAVAQQLLAPGSDRADRLYQFIKARESRRLKDPFAHALAYSAWVCGWSAAFLLFLAGATVVAALLV